LANDDKMVIVEHCLVTLKNAYDSITYKQNDKLMYNDQDFLLFTGVHASRVYVLFLLLFSYIYYIVVISHILYIKGI